ncbi:MAG: phosphoenolpyruvate carboxylase [Archaeoglobus sp.]|jgi:phosphoenolpyruvate carboxylase|nr:MAG: phosphoenolpyruvate carboxylase [Archaeoglobus sp.]
MMDDRKIPRTMSTQHPDNVNIPFFCEYPVIKGDDEVREAYYAFSHLGCNEQMWDYEGKDVDVYVVKKLLSRYSQFFYDVKLGKDVFLTFRIPNPSVEKSEAKVMLEVLESIPRSCDSAKIFYDDDTIPVFEVILPMTSNSAELNRVYYYYTNFVVGKANKKFFCGDITIKDWIGEFKPERINVIPLFEDRSYVLESHSITEKFVEDKLLSYQRVFLAKSDLAMNYGGFSSDIYLRKALFNLASLEDKTGVRIYPIVGFGSPPFRGNLRPDNVLDITRKWKSVFTFTVQSAFKYDYPEKVVVRSIEKLNSINPKLKVEDPGEEMLNLADKIAKEYRRKVLLVADIVNALSAHVPRRRARRLHVGLFGYSRDINGVQLPRAIPFCCSLYSIGLPPELIGLSNLSDEELGVVVENYYDELNFSLRFFSRKVCHKLGLEKVYNYGALKEFGLEIGDFELAEEVYNAFRRNRVSILTEKILQAARLRKFLG